MVIGFHVHASRVLAKLGDDCDISDDTLRTLCLGTTAPNLMSNHFREVLRLLGLYEPSARCVADAYQPRWDAAQAVKEIKEDYLVTEAQCLLRRFEKDVLGLPMRQVKDRQNSRFVAMCKEVYGGHKYLEAFLKSGSLQDEVHTRMITRPAQRRPERNFLEDGPEKKRQRMTLAQRQKHRDRHASKNIEKMNQGQYVKMHPWQRQRAFSIWKQLQHYRRSCY